MSLLVPSQTAGIGSVRWDEARAQHGEDVIALSVADMDFRAPQQVTDAIMDRAGQGAFCYTYLPPSFHELVSEWFARRHGWAFGPEAVVPVGRVVEALPALLQEFTSDGARIVVPTPAYGPIPEAVRAAGREVVPWALRAGSRYEFDLTSLAGLLEQSDALILTNPHNPTGRVWEEAELSDIAAIARRAGALVISDEVHADFLMPGFAFTSFTACAASTQPAISFTSPGKTFNMAGLETVNMIIPNGDVRERAARAVYDAGYHNPRFFTEVATRAAYTHGELWLDELLALLAQHVSLLEQHVTGEGSAVRLRRVEGTFLAWLDCRELQLSDRQIQERLGEHGLVLSLGSDFSAGEEGFVRMNLAVPTPRFEAALERFTAALA